jgi:3-oxoacyl-[acyl-carrier-protein] synthase II
VFGSGIGGIATFEEQHRKLIESGPNRVSPFFVPMFIPDISAGLISMRWGLRGPNYATVSACASSAHAIGNAARHIRYGDADVMVAGGSEATITPMT